MAQQNPQLLGANNVWIRALAMSFKKLFTLLDLCVSSLRRGHANLLCIVPILTDDPRRESNNLDTPAGRVPSAANMRTGTL